MERKIIVTRDGSHSISIPELKVTYHSVHGAIQESKHVFLEAGFDYRIKAADAHALRILEMGFGTGLNAFLTLLEAEGKKIPVHYTAIEPNPLADAEACLLNYPGTLGNPGFFDLLHGAAWEQEVRIAEYFVLKKIKCSLSEFTAAADFDLIYYDAFAPSAQPELWTQGVFQKLFGMMAVKGILVTYCSKGDVRRAMQAAGFEVKKIPGPPGKREMLRASKPSL